MTDRVTWLRGQVEQRIAGALQRAAERQAHIGDELGPVFAITQRLSAGGKRLRAAFAYLGWLAVRDTDREHDIEPLLRCGAGLELFHLAALVHDDLIDGSETRRGEPSAHRQFMTEHRHRSMINDEADFGAAGAILLGDLLMVLASHELSHAVGMVAERAAERSRVLVTDMMGEVTLGQYLDFVAQSSPWSTDPQVDLDRAHRVVVSKSARYSVEHPMLLGAALAGGSSDHSTRCSRIGLPIGEAFQLRDDLLGVFGEPALTGKPSGDDLREGKRTVLITTALTLASSEEGAFLKAVLGTPLTDDDVRRVRDILTDCGAVAEVEGLIDRRIDQARAAIAESGWTRQARDLAVHLLEAATRRTA